MEIKSLLKKYFGYEEFRRGQENLVESILQKRDVLGIMPTGGGKSLCYQLPALALSGISIIVSPLISLMKDQVDSLKELGIEATYINSSLEYNEVLKRLDGIKAGRYKLVYAAPERINTEGFAATLRNMEIAMIAVDEAHCISQWGHDFRPSYMEIPRFIRSLKKRPVVAAFTATATVEVVEEIKRLLELNNPAQAVTGFDRPNLYYQVVKSGDKFSYILDFLRKNHTSASGVIYCATRDAVESMARKLREKGIDAVGYHGGMDPDIRKKNQEDFIYDRTRIIVATNAFGMGIDKPDVRFVIHYNMPKNMEAYYQEAGRAGRDGESSVCLLMYSPSDIVKQKYLIQSEDSSEERVELQYKNLQYIIDYCHTNDCLRQQILMYFGERGSEDKCGNCGNCLDNSEMADVTLEAQKILSCIHRVNGSYGITTIIQILRGSKNKKLLDLGFDKLSTYGIMADYSEEALRELIMTLVSKGYIQITTGQYPVIKFTLKSKEILKGEIVVYHKKRAVEIKAASKSKKELKGEVEEKEVNAGLLDCLKSLRSTIAKSKNLPPYMIFHDTALKEMASKQPSDKAAFLDIKGVGLQKYESYGAAFIKVINEFTA